MSDAELGPPTTAVVPGAAGGEVLAPYSAESFVADVQNSGPGLDTGYENLDRAGVVFPRGAITAVFAPVGHGKTTFLLNLLVTMLKTKPDLGFVYLSYKEPRAQVALKIIHKESGANLGTGENEVANLEQFIRFQGEEAASDEGHVSTSINDFGKWARDKRLWLLGDGMCLEDVEATVVEIANQVSLGVIFVDYFQAVQVRTAFPSVEAKDAWVASRLREVARRLNVAVVVGARLIGPIPAGGISDLGQLDQARGIEIASSFALSLFNETAAGVGDDSGNSKKDSDTLAIQVLKNERGPQGGKARLMLKRAKMLVLNAGDMRT